MIYWIEPIKAREQIEYLDSLGSLFDAEAGREYQLELAKRAFHDEPLTLAARIEALTRKG